MMKNLLVLVSILICQIIIAVDAKIRYANSSCYGEIFNYTSGSAYEKNLNLLLDDLTSKSSTLKFYNSTFGNAPDKVYGLFQCRNDISLGDCNQCIKGATQKIIEHCPLYGEAAAFYYECTLWYKDYDSFTGYATYPGWYRWSQRKVSDYAEFAPILARAMNRVTKNASSSMPHFASDETKLNTFQQLYSFAQCTPNIDASDCNFCLETALSEMSIYANASDFVIIFMPSCQLRYDTVKPIFSDQPSSDSSPAIDEGDISSDPPSSASSGTSDQGPGASKKSSLNPSIIGGITACALVVLLVVAVVLWICLRRKKPANLPEDTVNNEGHRIGDTEFVQFDFATLEFATRNFSAENKLGEGGFGSVYKGQLRNGDQLAIKRLSGTGGQGTKEFMTEAHLLAKLQHKNLVKLLGFCCEGDEKLLVYEFMSNGSLDGFLFDQRKRPLLYWVIRHKIIMGIARGLQYLHEDSRLTIIHRDLKPANILLDEDMNPKIADFGLAKLFGNAEKFGNTARIVGTRGYMAPEYLLSGDYSDKSDVYSFGMMLLEIVSGQRNRISNPSQQQEDLSVQAWRLWTEGRSFDFVDPMLFSNCSSNELVRCIQIGLLCLQRNASERPTMTAVVHMLTGSEDLPHPLPPAMSSNEYSGTEQSDLYSTNSFTSPADFSHETQDLYPTAR